MAKLDEQIRTMKGYFEADCEAEGKLSLGLEVEHFVTPVSYTHLTLPTKA